MRKFEFVTRFRGNDSSKLPVRATEGSAGYDMFAAESRVIRPGCNVLVSTGCKAYMEKGEVLILANRSSNAAKKGLLLLNGIGVIDSDYVDNDNNEGEIFFCFYNNTNHDIEIKVGDKLGQGIFIRYVITDDDVPEEVERHGGFGSTDK